MPADFDEPVFDEEFVRNAAFTEPSARERAQPPRRARLWRPGCRL
ncbi:SCO2583/SCO2584 N-terminal domain-containing protein, partial [Actinomadura montaniterrae]